MGRVIYSQTFKPYLRKDIKNPIQKIPESYYDPKPFYPKPSKPYFPKRHYEGLKYFPDSWTNLSI